MLIDSLEKYSNKKNILIGIGFILFVNIVAFPLFPKIYSDTPYLLTNILDVKFGFSLETILNSLSLMQEEGRDCYLFSTIIIDIPYALVYGFVYSFIIIFLFKKVSSYKSFKFLAIIPFFISLFDLIENFGIVYFINKFPIINSNIAYSISLSNQLKWGFSLLTFLLVLVLSIRVLRQAYIIRANK